VTLTLQKPNVTPNQPATFDVELTRSGPVPLREESTILAESPPPYPPPQPGSMKRSDKSFHGVSREAPELGGGGGGGGGMLYHGQRKHDSNRTNHETPSPGWELGAAANGSNGSRHASPVRMGIEPAQRLAPSPRAPGGAPGLRSSPGAVDPLPPSMPWHAPPLPALALGRAEAEGRAGGRSVSPGACFTPLPSCG